MTTRTLRYVALAAVSMGLGATLAAQAADNPAAPAAAAPAAPAAPPTDPNQVVITMGDQKITAGEFAAFVSVLPAEVQAMANGAGRRGIADELVRLRLLSAEARTKKLDESPRFKQQLDVMRDNILVGLLLQQIQGTLITDDDIKKDYEAHKATFERVTARHILISTMSEKKLTDEEANAKDAEAKAKIDEIRKQIVAKPDSFGEIAKAESMDPGSKDQGGDLQPFGRSAMVKEFEDVAFALKPGDISEPVKTPFGYHIIQVVKHETPGLDEVKEAVADKLRQERFEALFADLKKKADPKLDETFFGPPPKPADAAAGDAPAAPAKQ